MEANTLIGPSRVHADLESDGQWLRSDYQPTLVSIIVPAFNAEATIEETLNSVHSQSFRPIELIVVDDGSKDRSGELAKKFEADFCYDATFKVRTVFQPNKGAPSARNSGARLSSGEYVAFLDADDTLHPDKIRHQVLALQRNKDWEFCYGPIAFLEDPDRKKYGNRSVDWRSAALRQLGWPFFQTAGPLFRRHFLNKLGPWNENLRACQDWELHSRMVMLQPHFGWVKNAIAYYRQSGDPESRVSIRNFKARKAPEKVLQAREQQLRSLIAHAPQILLRAADFRRNASWEMIRLARTEANSGMQCSARKLYAEARQIADGTITYPLATVASALCHIKAITCAGWLISAIEWTFYRCTGLLARLKIGCL